jgi:hypothetical protein
VKKEFSLFEFLWRTSLVLVFVFFAALNLIVGVRDGNGQAIFAGLILCVPTFFLLLGWLDRFYDYFFSEKKFK